MSWIEQGVLYYIVEVEGDSVRLAESADGTALTFMVSDVFGTNGHSLVSFSISF